jgi:hypothetical protein
VSEGWCIWADLEGFRWCLGQDKLQALVSLGEVMRAIFRIGKRCYPEPPNRLFAHQFGDGFVITSEYHEPSLDRCVAIAVAILRHVAASGCYARAAIAEGDMADIQGCYPDEVMSQSDGHRVMLDAGIMTITPVMGTALTHAVGLSEKGKPASSGPLLILSSDDDSRVDLSLPRQAILSTGLLAIDWVHAKSDLLAWVQSTAMLDRPSAGELEAALAEYCTANPVTAPWAANVHNLLGVPS